MKTFERRAELATWIGLSACGLGVAIVIVRSWVEYLNTPGITIVDGYWMGREPWSSMGVVPVLAGSALGTLAAGTLVMLRGDWLRRILSLAILAVPVIWWLIALGAIPVGPYYRPPDPVTLAYSLPQQAAIMLLIPALAIAALAFLPHRADTRVRLRRVHPEQPTYR
jgi:hypothetical protein